RGRLCRGRLWPPVSCRRLHGSALARRLGNAADHWAVLPLGRPRRLCARIHREVPLRRVVLFGGYGVFGAQVARALSKRGTPLTIAGRDPREAEALASHLGGDCSAAAVDIRRPEACRALLQGPTVAVNCAGPFHCQGAALLEACLQSGSPYVDISYDRG